MDFSFLSGLITNALLSPFSWYGITFLGTFLTGENMILTSFVTIPQSPALFPGTFLAALLATLSADLFWYTLARTVLPRFTLFSRLRQKTWWTSLTPFFNAIHKNPLFFLLIIKFLVGARTILLVSFVLKGELSFRRFFFYDTLGSILFVATLAVVGWSLGLGVAAAFPVYRSLTHVLLFFVLFSIFFHVFGKNIRNFFLKVFSGKTRPL